jgi:hypothetical protein
MQTPETLHEELLDELRRAVADHGALAHPRRYALRVRRHALRQRLPRAGALALAAVAIGCALGAAVVLILHWPPGGGKSVSQLAVAQGASLVFVVLLLSLLPGVVDAGESIGWEPAWILRDRLTWLGFSAVALLSLGDLTVAWAQPEHAEEGGTILMTACGLAITGLLVRRLLRMSDPGEQLSARVSSQVPKLVAILNKERDRAAKRAAEHDLGKEAARLLSLTPHPGAQSGMASVIRQMMGLASRYAQDARWDQAQKAFELATQSVTAYVQAGRRMHMRDTVLLVYGERTNDLHALAEGPAGRDLSAALFSGLAAVGRTIATSHLEHHIREGAAVHRLGFVARQMLARRVPDESSADAAAGLSLLGELASSAALIGDSASATSIADNVLPFAVAATVSRQSHIAMPAWSSAVRVLGVLALVSADVRNTAALSMWAESLANVIATLPGVPHPLSFSGAEPVFSNEPAGGSLMYTMAAIWASDLDGDTKDAVDRRFSEALDRVMRSTSDPPRAAATVIEVYHQLACAGAACAERCPSQAPIALQALARHLSRIRTGWRLDPRSASALHIYTTDWIIALFVTREQAELPAPLAVEIEAFGAAIEALPPPVGAHAAESLQWLDLALKRAGRAPLAERVVSWKADSGVPTGRLYQLGRGHRRLHTGLLVTSVRARAEEWWLAPTDRAGAE